MADFSVFARYKPLLPPAEWPAFIETLNRPLPTCIWANPQRVTPQQLAALLTAEDIPFEVLPWQTEALQIPADFEFKPGYHWAFWAGLYHVQEAVSMLPVLFLQPQPGERVLDLCAAPGNKTAQIGLKMENQGTVIANDISGGRMRAARQVLDRMGLVNVTTTTANGTNYPNAAGQFSKILVDAPCSCEGTARKQPSICERISPALARRKSGLQRALLHRAVQLCQPGGQIVYATCTFAPEENELVVQAILKEYGPELLRLIPLRLPGLVSAPGITQWAGQLLDPTMRHAMRVWPQQNNTGGFFIAMLQKSAIQSNERATMETAPLPPPAPAIPEMAAILAERFGVPAALFTSYHLFRHNRKRLHLINATHQLPHQPPTETIGLSFMKTTLRYPKLSTAAALQFGAQAQRNFVELTPAQVADYINRRGVTLSAPQAAHCTSMGYVIVRHKEFPLGVGLYHPFKDEEGTAGGHLESMFPKAWSPTGQQQ